VQHWKGPQVLCEALHLLGDRAPAIDWIGRDVPIHHQGGSTSQYLAKTWPEIWGSRIRHLPGENPVQIHARQRSAGFVVVPSIWDVFNFACVEAMEAATPVVCSSGAGASELIEAGVSGFVAEPGNARSLADEIDRLLSLGPRARQAIGEAGADVISRTLSPEAVLPAQLDFYRSVAGRAERPRTPSEWFAATCEPASMVPSLDAALGQLPLRRLIQHSLGRIKDRLSLPRAHR
jgi:glycosyltransferase involved in cell wall biosynthesis